MRARAAIAALLLVLASGAQAATTTYWVSPTGTAGASGADSTTNATTLAWVNANAAARISAGDNVVVRFKSGAYTSPIQPNANGLSSRRISYYGFPNDRSAVRVTDIRFGWNGSNSKGDYTTVKWVTVTGQMSGCDEVAALYATGDSIVNVHIPAAGGGFDFRTNLTVLDSCTFAAGSITGTGQSHFIDMFNANTIYASGNRITNNTFTITVNTTASQGDVHILGMARAYGNIVYGNTFNLTVTACFGYFFPVQVYRGYYNSFQSNTFNLTMNATPGGTHSIVAFRDSTSFTRFFGNTVTSTGSGAIGLGWNNGGSFPGSTQSNYLGNNTFKLSNVDGGGIFYSQDGCRGDTVEFNLFATSDTDPAMYMDPSASFLIPISNTIFRHNTCYTAGGTVVSFANTGSVAGSRIVSGIYYGTSANGAGSAATVIVPSGMAMDSLGLIFNRGGTSGNAIRYGGTNGAPGSGTTGYGLSGKALWNTPTFTDSTYATLNATLLGGSPATTSTLQDGYAGAYGTASADVTAPSAISTLAAGAATSNTIPLTWTSTGDDAGSGTATSYDLRYATFAINAGNFSTATRFTTGVPAPLVAGTSQGVTVTGLTPSTSYQFAIKATDEANNTSTISNVVGQSTSAAVDVTPPAAVIDLSANGQSVSSIALLWTSPGDDGNTGTATTYDVRRNTTDITAANWGSSYQLTNETAPKAAGGLEVLVDAGLSSGTVYYYALKTSDEEGNVSGLSNVAAGETSPDVTPPNDPTALAATSPSTTRVDLTWISSGDDGTAGSVSSYIMKRSTSTITSANFNAATTVALRSTEEFIPGAAFIPRLAAGQQEYSINDGLDPATTYYYAVKACDEVPNCSGISNVATVTTGSDADVTAPAAISTLASNASTTNSVDLTWTAPGDDGNTGTATSYDIRYSTSTITDGAVWNAATQATAEPIPLVAGTTQAFTVPGLASSTTYYFAMKTSDEVPNVSAISNVLSKATVGDVTAPAVVGNLAVVATGSGTVTLQWTAPGDDGATGTATSYDVRYTTGGALIEGGWAAATNPTGEPIPSVAGSIETMTISGLSNGTTYYFAIKTTDEAANQSAISNSPSGTPTANTATTGRARRYRRTRG